MNPAALPLAHLEELRADVERRDHRLEHFVSLAETPVHCMADEVQRFHEARMSGFAFLEMRRLFKEGKAGHSGFMESLHLIGHAMNWSFSETYEVFEPVIAPFDISTQFFKVSKGQCCGIHQIVVGNVGSTQRV